jgi:hypothetical protein
LPPRAHELSQYQHKAEASAPFDVPNVSLTTVADYRRGNQEAGRLYLKDILRSYHRLTVDQDGQDMYEQATSLLPKLFPNRSYQFGELSETQEIAIYASMGKPIPQRDQEPLRIGKRSGTSATPWSQD